MALTHGATCRSNSYEAGVIPLTDVLDANRQLLASQDDLAPQPR